MRQRYLRRKVEDLKFKALLLLKAKEAGFPAYDLYLENPEERSNHVIYLKLGARVLDREVYSRYLTLIKDISPESTIKADRTFNSIDPSFFLSELAEKLKTTPSISKEVSSLFRKISRNPLISGVLLRMKGKVNSLRTRTKIFKQGKIAYTGNYLINHRKISRINYATKRGVVGFKLILFYPEPFEEL